MKAKLITIFFLSWTTLFGQGNSDASLSRKITFPDIPGYVTLKCDLHQHTVFSDGNVWPSIRVEEAIKDGLDAISITDHLEYQPHIDDIPHPNRNRSYEIAAQTALRRGLIVITGSEITRNMPPGHSNAIFIKDANKLLIDDPMEVFREAKRQGAFIFWNHPSWLSQASDGIARLTDMHRELLKEGLLDGIEVVNNYTYSDEAVSIANEHNLTMLGTSDIHGLIDWQYNVPAGGHRPVTLVFAKEKTLESIKEALFAHRTAVWMNNMLIGPAETLTQLVKSSLEVTSAAYITDKTVLRVQLQNNSDADFIAQNLSGYTLHQNGPVMNIKPQASTELQIKTLEVKESINLKLRIFNALVAPETYVEIDIPVSISSE
jgi:predicted metal-dependent phosphoesterase TrpH